VIEEVLEAVPDFGMMQSMESIVAVDAWARSEAESRAGGDLR
jgi:1-deoxy-D-xylulose 5-phosphate reductoisomerase